MKLPANVNVLLLGGGGREHALAWKIAQSPRTARLFIAPGNAGTAQVGTNVELQATNFGALKQFLLQNHIHLVVVGPEEPLVRGVADFVHEDRDTQHVAVIGPGAKGARLEGSKAFAKEFMQRHGVPTAAYRSFTKETIEDAFEFLGSLRAPYVLKADGLAAGKGVVIASSLDEARRELAEMLGGRFGAAGATVVIEEYLGGIECSVFVATDGRNYRILPVAKDYKRIGEGDTGLNTGGMGAVSPVPFADAEFMRRVEERIVRPTVAGLVGDGIDYKGFIFVGLMNVGGNPFVIEYNVRLGDPETEAVMMRLSSDIMELFEGIVFGFGDFELVVSNKTAVTVVCVAEGYPGDYLKGDEISFGSSGSSGSSGSPDGSDSSDSGIVFHAGTALQGGRTITTGGRVLAVTALGDSLEAAITAAYSLAENVHYDGKYFRRDIGLDLE